MASEVDESVEKVLDEEAEEDLMVRVMIGDISANKARELLYGTVDVSSKITTEQAIAHSARNKSEESEDK